MKKRFVVVVCDNDGGEPAVICDDLESAKQACRERLDASDQDPPLSTRERAAMEEDLTRYDGDDTQSIRGSEAWKCYALIAPLAD